MPNILKPKRSATAAKVPTTTDLSSGELGVNMTDRKVYINNGTDVVQVGAGLLSALGDTVITAPSAGQALSYNGTNWVNTSVVAGTGTVTSVGVSVPVGLSVTGSPVTTTGTIAISLASGYSIPTTTSQTTWDTASTERRQWDGGNANLVAATGRTSLGATTLGSNLFTLTNVAAVSFPRINADNTISTLDAAAFRGAIGAGTSSTTGTVTSVGGTGTVSGLTLTGTVTSTGNLALGGTLSVLPSNFASQTANTVLAAPNGAAGAPTFRALVAADIPALTLENLPDAWAKRSVRVATTANITLSGTQTIDGIAVVAGDRVLVKDQTAQAENGIYVVAAGAWSRAADANISSKMAASVVGVDSGTANGGFSFDNDFKATDTLGTTAMSWSRVVDTGLASSASPAMDGTATVGTSISYARADHIHPTDTSRAPSAGSTSITTLGTIATGTWQATVIGSAYGGTGVNNGSRTLTINTNSGTLAFTNASTTLTVANAASVSGTNTGDQTITLTGDVTGSGTGSFAATLANSGVTAGTYTAVTVDAKGRTTAGVATPIKQPVRLATTIDNADLTLSGLGTIDQVLIANGDRVLVKNNVGTQNGIYIVNSSGAWTRATDANTAALQAGALVPVLAGVENSGKIFKTTFSASGTLGTTPLFWGELGTVTTVSGTGTVSGLTLSGAVTSSGNLTLGGTLAVTPSNFASQTANTVLAAPNGSAGAPTFRTLVAADIPTLNQNTTGTASNVTGTVAIANGGTGATTASAALTALGAYAASNPSGYTSNTGTVTSVGGTGTVSGLTLSGTVTGSGNLTLGGTLSLTSGNVTTALGFTPYNSTNPSGYITSSASITGSSNRIAFADTRGVDDQPQGKTGYALAADFKNNTSVSSPPVTASATYSHILTVAGWDTNGGSGGWPSQLSVGDGIAVRQATSATVWGAWRTVLHSNNFNSYAPTLTGTGASGSWGISVTGTAANVTGTVAVANGGTGATTAAVARTNLGATTLGGNLFTLANVAAISFPRFNADNTVSALDAATFRTAIGAGTSSTTGTVTSVGGTGTVSGLTLSGTVTNTGNLTLGGTLSVAASNFASQTANTILAAPTGVNGVPTFRGLVAADVPTLNQNTTGTAANVTGTVAIANGGTGATTAAAALTALGAYAATNPSGYTSNTGTVTSITAGTGLSGGAITTSGTIALANTAVTAGSYTLANITVDAQGRITAASSGSAPATNITTTAGTTAGPTINSSTGTGAVIPSASATASGIITTGAQTFAGVKTFATDTGFGSGTGIRFLNVDSGVTNAIRFTNAANSAYVATFGNTGDFTAAGNVTAYSDERLKTDWAGLPVDFVERLALVKSGTYTRIDSGERQAGASAQAMQKLLTEVVSVGDDEDKTLSLAYGNAALLAAIELAKRVVLLEERLKKLEPKEA